MTPTTLPTPTPGTWELDPAHSSIEFVIPHLMVSKVRGRFGSFAAVLKVGDDPQQTKVSATIDPTSINTNQEFRDTHLRTADFFDVEHFPKMTFVSTAVHPKGAEKATVEGNLEIRGVSNPVALEVEYLGLQKSPQGHQVAIFEATTELEREQWGLSWNAPLESGGVLLGKKLKVEINAQFKPQIQAD